jgi:homeobox protein cut-like
MATTSRFAARRQQTWQSPLGQQLVCFIVFSSGGMDPSEFEGTVERSEEAVSAGVLEQLLQDTGPKFELLDFTKDLGDLHLAMYTLKETVTQYEEASLSTVTKELDVVAMKLAELKEDYVTRRKNLTAQVKQFTAQYLSDSEDSPFAEACKSVLSLFKKEFDGLSTLAKFSESAFLDIYKILRELPDPVLITTQGLSTCVKMSELLGKAQEQLQIADVIISEASAPAVSAGSNQHVVKQAELDRIHQQYEAEKEELRQSYLNEMANLRIKYESDMRSRELSLTSIFDKQQHELEQQLEAVAAKKDVEISSLLRSLSDFQSKNQELDERSRLLDAEMLRRRELEEKWRASVVSISDMTTASQELSASLERANTECRDLRAKLDAAEMSAGKQQGETAHQIAALTEKVRTLESQVSSRPPVDLSALMSSIESMAGFRSDFGGSSGAERLSWGQFEARLLEALRRSDAEATQSRVKLQDSARQLADLQAQTATLNAQLTTQTSLVASLELDLHLAHEAVQATTASRGSKMAAKMFKAINPRASDAQLESLIAQKGDGRSAGTEDLEANDSRTGASTPNAAAGALVADSSYNVNDRILQAVQGQRDRYMRASKEKDGELVELKAKLDRLTDEQVQLRNENLELYRRLRVLRVSGGNGAQAGIGATHGASSGAGSDQHARSRRGPGSDVSSGVGGLVGAKDDFNLDEKYMSLYEAEISPFRVEELDRQQMLSRLNFFERGLAYVNRHILQDRWARHALLVYLALVHVLALIYISEVLNPQLIDEVDAHMKAKWSTETLSMPEHPDN